MDVRTRMLVVALFAVVNAVVLAGLETGSGRRAVVRQAASSAPELAPPPASMPRRAEPPCVPAPLEQRAGQVLVVGLPGVRTASDPRVGQALDLHVGGLMLTQDNIASPSQVTQMVAAIRARAARPLLLSSDEESGRVSRFRAVVGASPSARRMARSQTPEAVRQFAQTVGAKLAAVGINLDFAPVLDLDGGPAGGIIGDRSFSDDPATASTYALAYGRGLAAAGVLPTAKHFPGHGTTRQDTHDALPTVGVSLSDLRARDLKPFATLVDAGVPAVMMNHVAYTALDPQLPASLSPRAYQLLREMGFRGVAITDSVGMGAVNPRWPYPEAAVRAIQAGADAVLASNGNNAGAMRDALVAAVRSGRIDEQRLNEAAARVLALAGGDPTGFACRSVQLPSLR